MCSHLSAHSWAAIHLSVPLAQLQDDNPKRGTTKKLFRAFLGSWHTDHVLPRVSHVLLAEQGDEHAAAVPSQDAHDHRQGFVRHNRPHVAPFAPPQQHKEERGFGQHGDEQYFGAVVTHDEGGLVRLNIVSVIC